MVALITLIKEKINEVIFWKTTTKSECQTLYTFTETRIIRLISKLLFLHCGNTTSCQKKRPYLVTFQDHLRDNHGPMHQVTFTTDNCLSKLSFEAISLLIWCPTRLTISCNFHLKSKAQIWIFRRQKRTFDLTVRR